MKIRQAQIFDFSSVKDITKTTIETIYPKYYPNGAVQFFLAHHSDNNIMRDIKDGKVYLLEDQDKVIGTITICQNEINRFFVRSEYQHKGYGKILIDFAEKMILQNFTKITLAASFPAKKMYKKRGYFDVEYNMIETENGDYLCYDVMCKKSTK